MNHTYVLVWSPTLQSYVPAAETARRQGKRNSGKALLPAVAVLGAALLSSPAFAQVPPLAANALPTGGQVVAGQASIGQNGSQLTVTQGSDKAILNWNSFNIGRDARVQFQQPGSSAVALNRVLGSDASQIQGQLSANGQVWLVNPNGVVFGAGSRVDVGGLVASTLSITDKDFLDGKAVFTRDGATGSIVNEGRITAIGDGEQGGLIALLAPTVRNDGVLTTRLGNVALAAGDRITLNAGAGGLLQVDVQPATIRTLVENRQLIVADGGQVVMTGKAADALSGSVVANTGTVQARSLATRDGRIMLLADGGSAQVSGLLDASGAVGQGGSIDVTGQQVVLAGATLDASGATGGGEIKVGGGWQGGGALARAKTTSVDAGSSLTADATQKGEGGTVVVWSDDKTRYAGHISAKGGSTGGKGGKAEVSGKAVLEFTGTADLSAAEGRFGDLLLDPYNLSIVSGSGGTAVAAADDSTLGADTLTAALAGANVTVSTGGGGSQAGDITVNAPVAWSANTVLSLEAAGNIAINKNIAATGANAGLELSYGAGKDYQIGEGASITLSGTSATLAIGVTGALNTYTLLRDVTALQAIPGNSSGRFALANNIDASSLANFAPIADFGGTFTGLGHVINGLTINRPTQDNVGLFGSTNSSNIRNVGLVGGSVIGGRNVGGLVGSNYGAITGAFTTGTVRAEGDTVLPIAAVGGLVGNNVGNISRAYATGAVNTTVSTSGGLVGDNSGTIDHAYATGAVTGGETAGGLVGLNRGSIRYAYATGSVAGTSYVGGLTGYNYQLNSTIIHAYATGSVSGTGQFVGGLAGINHGSLDQAYSTGAVNGQDFVGGLVGYGFGGSSIKQAYATGTVRGASVVGGLVGWNEGDTITDAYAAGAVTSTGTSEIGGLVGRNSGIVTRSFYATTNANGSTVNNGGSTVAPWSGNTNGSGRTYLELMAPATFTGWDSTIWTFIAGGSTIAGYEVALPSLTGVTRAADVVRGTLFQGGMGNAGNPYAIADWQQLANINAVASSPYTYNLGNNLDGTTGGYAMLASATSNGGLGWKPLGDGTTSFKGTFDGQNHTISGLTINRPTEGNVGLFGVIDPGSAISNIGLLGASVIGQSYVGALVGGSQGGSTISRAYASGDVRGTFMVGGLVGSSLGDISQAYASTNVTTSTVQAGGLAGSNGGAITHSYATGAVSGSAEIGGLVGNLGSSGTIDYAYATSAVSGTNQVGGLVGSRFFSVAAPTNTFYATTDAGGSAINNGGSAAGAWTGNADGTGKTHAELMTSATFSGWGATLATAGGSTAIWRIYQGNTAPLLRSFLQAATVTADLSAGSKTYDGSIASGTATYIKNVPGSLLGTLSYASNSANAGSYTNTDGTLTFGGLYSGQRGYDISYAPASLSITPVVLLPPGPPSIPTAPSINGALTGTVSKTYDGTTSATLGSGNFLLSGWVSTDGAIVTQTTGRYDSADAGSGKTVTVDLSRSDYQATGTTNLGNYILPTQISGAVGTINKAALTVSANDAGKTYDGQAWRGGNGVRYSGFVNGETTAVLTGALNYGGTSQGAVDAGTYLLTPQGLNSGNYAIDYRNGSLSVASIPGGGNPGSGNPGSGNPGNGNPGGADPGASIPGGDTGGGNTGGGDTGGGKPGSGNTGGGGTGGGTPVGGITGGNNTGNENTGNVGALADSGPVPSGSNLWRALNRATPLFMLPQDTDSRREISVPHLSLAPGYIRLQEED
jgi:filamentous hemagglutinin family protein